MVNAIFWYEGAFGKCSCFGNSPTEGISIGVEQPWRTFGIRFRNKPRKIEILKSGAQLKEAILGSIPVVKMSFISEPSKQIYSRSKEGHGVNDRTLPR